jgi:hypothetical protein
MHDDVGHIVDALGAVDGMKAIARHLLKAEARRLGLDRVFECGTHGQAAHSVSSAHIFHKWVDAARLVVRVKSKAFDAR